MSVTVYGKPGCTQCNASYRKLDKDGTPYTKIDVSQDPEAFDLVKSLGYTQVPVTVTDDEHWYGFVYDKLDALKPVPVEEFAEAS
jgi:glutaredoxin-like protein NrdH